MYHARLPKTLQLRQDDQRMHSKDVLCSIFKALANECLLSSGAAIREGTANDRQRPVQSIPTVLQFPRLRKYPDQGSAPLSLI